MKKGLFIYQAPPFLGRNVQISSGAFTNFSFLGFGKGKRFLDTLQNRLDELNYSVVIEKDETEADLEKIASLNYDFILCAPGLQKKMFNQEELPQIFYLNSLDYYNAQVDQTIHLIEQNVL